MVIGLDSPRKQLQWRLIYATFDVDSVGFAARCCLFCQRPIIPFRAETTRAKAHATANAQSIRAHSEAGATEGKSILAQAGDAGQYAHRRLGSQTAGLPHDRRPSRGRWSHLVRPTRARDTERTLYCAGKGPQSSLESLRRF